MSSQEWRTDPETRTRYRVTGSRQGGLRYKVDDEKSQWLSEAGFKHELEKRNARPRDHRRHEPDNVPGHRTLSTSAELEAHQGPLRRLAPHDIRLFADEGDLPETRLEEPRRSSNYQLHSGGGRILVEPATSGRRAPDYGVGRGVPPNLDTSLSRDDSGTGVPSALRNTDPTNQSGRDGPAQSSQLSLLARQFISLGLGNYADSGNFVADHPSIVVKSEIDTLIAEASIAEKAAQSTRAQTCIHQALILRECEKVGPRNFDSFFRKMTAKEARDAFIRDVKKVYVTIQHQAGRIQPQTEGATSELSVRKRPVISQPTREVDSPNSYVHAQRQQAAIQSQTPVARGPDGRLFYTDNRGNLLRPASGRHDPDRHRANSDPVAMTETIAAVSIGEATQASTGLVSDVQNSPGRTAPLHRAITSDTLPTLHENPQYKPPRHGGNEYSAEKLNDRYRIRKDAGHFFSRGRVFAVLWPEIDSRGGGQGSKREPSERVATGNTRYGEKVFSHIRRMVVVKEDHGHCLCLAINTYQGNGVDKPGFNEGDKRAHSVIHNTGIKPSCTATELQYLDKKAIAVDCTSDGQKLDTMSRLNYKKIYTVEHNVKVMPVGRVNKDSLVVLLGYWRMTLE